MDQVFALKNICEKYLYKQRSVYGIHGSGEGISYNNKDALWRVLRIYGVEAKLLEMVRSFYQGYKMRV